MSEICPLCGSTGTLWTKRGQRDLLRCPSCGFAWVPQGVLRNTDGISIYEDEAGALFEAQADYYRDAGAREAAKEKLRWISGFSPPGGRLLDVGANLGLFVEEAGRRYEAIGLEPSAAAVQLARAEGRAGVGIGSIDEEIQDFIGRFDVITLFDVIEHLPNPRAALERCRRYLKPEGKLFLTTPDTGSVVARLMGARWHYLDLDQHISIFSAANLRTLLEECGFAMTSRRTFGRRYRCSYIERRLGELGQDNTLLYVAHLAALPLRLLSDRHISINLRDVTGVVAERR